MANASASRQQDTRKDARDRPAQPEVCEVAPPVPPDGGYGWVIMLASFVCNFIVDGVCFSFGIFYLEFLDYFKESKSKTSWVGSVLNGMYLSMGKYMCFCICFRLGNAGLPPDPTKHGMA